MNKTNGKPDAEQGLYRKYDVRRLNDPAGKHAGCSYYVLDLDHDKYSVAALLAYAAACKGEFPTLAFDLRHTAAATARKLDYEPPAGEAAAARAAIVAVLRELVELKAIKRKIDARTATDDERERYKFSKEQAWLRAEGVLHDSPAAPDIAAKP